MSVQTNFRAQDMLGAAKPTKKAAPAPRVSAPAPRPEPIVIEPAVSVVEEIVEAPAAPEVTLED
jgi:hypothetical protein